MGGKMRHFVTVFAILLPLVAMGATAEEARLKLRDCVLAKKAQFDAKNFALDQKQQACLSACKEKQKQLKACVSACHKMEKQKVDALKLAQSHCEAPAKKKN